MSMNKLISVGSHDTLGSPRVHLIYPRETMAKLASSDRDGAMDLSIMPEELAQFWRDYDPDFDKHAFAHINIVSAFEYYGPNNNGDGFKEENIYGDGYYRTFEAAHPFLLHNNKDPKFGIGKVLASGYNLKMHRIEVISRLDKENKKSIEIIARIRSGRFPDVSMGCFLSGSMVTMADGTRKAIETIEVGEMVLSHKGVPRTVTKVHHRPYQGNIHFIRPEAHETIGCTIQHPWLTVTREQVKHGENRWKEEIDLSADWTHAECLNDDHFLLEPIITEVLTPDYVTTSFARLFGYYLAEGHVLRDKKKDIVGIEFSTHVDDTIHDEIESLCEDFGTKNKPVWHDRSHSEYAQSICVFDERLAALCYEHGGGYAKRKKLSYEAMRWDPCCQREILGAFANGDGTGPQDGSLKLSTSSTNLAWQLMALMPRLGVIASIQNLEHKAGKGFNAHVTHEWVIHIGKQWAQNLEDVCSKVVKSEILLAKNSRIPKDGYIITPIRSISALYADTVVHNLEVEGDESYLVSNLAVHNCRVPYDVCSICGKKAKTREEYCDHAANHMLQFYPYNDMTNRGRITCVFNTKPTFFDQSFVFTRADKGTFVIQELNKAAGTTGTSYHFIGYSADAGARMFKESAERKKAEMEKTSPDDITRDVQVVDKDRHVIEGASQAVMPELPLSACESLSKHDISDIFDTSALMGIHIMPKEYAVIKAYKDGDAPRAIVIKRYIRLMIAPKTASIQKAAPRMPRYNYKVAQILKPFMQSRSFLPRFDTTRAKGASLTKLAASAPCVSDEYTRHVLSTFDSIRNWEGEFYKNASLVVAGQSDIRKFVEGSELKTDPKVAAVRIGGAYMSFFGLHPGEK